MKMLLKICAVVCILLFVSISFIYAAGECDTRCCDEEYPRLVIQGEGRIETLPDKANFKVNIRTEEKKLERAFETSTERINAISEKLASNGVKKEDIKNLGYIYHPLYEGKRIFTTVTRPTSYEVIYTIKIAIYNMDILGKILSALSEVPETTVYGLEYTSTKIEDLKREVLKKAADDARQKALKLAEGAGAVLGKALKIETGVQVYPAKTYEEPFREMADVRLMQKEKIAPQIESGYLEIMGNCIVYYSIQ